MTKKEAEERKKLREELVQTKEDFKNKKLYFESKKEEITIKVVEHVSQLKLSSEASSVKYIRTLKEDDLREAIKRTALLDGSRDILNRLKSLLN